MIVTSIWNNPRERSRFLRFATVGMIGAVVDFGTFNLFTAVFHVQPVLASVFSFIAAIISNFTWNRYWTYPDSRSKAVSHQLGQFAIVSIVGLMIRTPIIAVLESVFGRAFSHLQLLPVSFITAQFLGNNSALATAVIVVMFWNFFINRYWTYSDIDSE
jgi:putative flippase GtrA